MIAAIRAAILKPQCYFLHFKAAAFFFHSTPALQRKHQSNSKARNKKFGKERAKQDFRRNVNGFAEHLFGIWSDGFDFSGKHSSWFEKQYSRVCKRNRNGRRHIPQSLDKSKTKRIFASGASSMTEKTTYTLTIVSNKERFSICVGCFDFCGVDEGFEIEYFLRTALGEEGEARSWRYSNNNGRSWGSRQRLDEEEEEEEEDDDKYKFRDSDSNQESHRHALGLSSSGPLNLEDVKNAYRVCALKWHPDRHQDSTKNAAEEKFKLCTVAYQSLCEKLSTN